MKVSAILDYLVQHPFLGGGGLLLLASLVEVAPIKINPWSSVLRFISNALTKDLRNQIGAIAKDVASIRNDQQQTQAENWRQQILRFGDECRRKERHSKEFFDQILDTIESYESYCGDHKEFKNGRTVQNCEFIRHAYEHCIENNDFL